jgi:hypothetical protein
MTISLILKWDPQGRLGWELAVVTGVSTIDHGPRAPGQRKISGAKR